MAQQGWTPEWLLEDLSHDVYIIGRVKITHTPWLILSFFGGIFLAALLPLPVVLKLVIIPLVPFMLGWWLHSDGPRFFRRWFTWKTRLRHKENHDVIYAPDAQELAVTATPICDLGNGRYMAAAMIQPPPFSLTDDAERQVRWRAWTQLLNTAAVNGVQVDVFVSRQPWSKMQPFLASMNPDKDDEKLMQLFRWRLRHFVEEARYRGYETTILIRFATGARNVSDAWYRIRACEAAFAGAGMRWEWVSGAYLAELSYDWADPGAAIRRLVWEAEKLLHSLEGEDKADEGADRQVEQVAENPV